MGIQTMFEVVRAALSSRKEEAPGVVLVNPTDGTPLGVAGGTPLVSGSAGIGEPADAAASTDSGTFSLIALVKRLLLVKLPASLGAKTAANSFAVALATDAEVSIKSGAGGYVTTTVLAAASESPIVDLGNKRLNRIGMPADIGAATRVIFTVSNDGATFRPLYDQYSVRYGIGVVGSGSFGVDAMLFAGVRYLQLQFVTGTTTASTHGSGRAVELAYTA